jgi:uncharacterized membrane protein YoaK (UPF0700 family)
MGAPSTQGILLLLGIIIYTFTDAIVSNPFLKRGGASALRRQSPIARRWLMSLEVQSKKDNPFQNDTSTLAEVLYSREKNVEDERLPVPPTYLEPIVSQHTILSVMSFLSASGDVICMKRHGGYANMMTGNIVRMAGAISEQRWGDSLRSCNLIMSYTLGTMLFRIILEFYKKNDKWMSKPATKFPPMVSPACLLLLTLGEILQSMPLLAMTGGLINAAAAHACSGAVVFAMSGHLSRVITAVFEYPSKKVWNTGATASLKILIWFLLGAMCTTILWNQGSSKPWFIIIGVLYSLILSFISLPKSSPKTMFSIQTMKGNFTNALALES